MSDRNVWAELSAPFPFSDVKLMPQSTTKDMSKALAVCYFDARAVMNRLDEVLTPAGWRAEYREVAVTEKAKGVICRLTVFVDGREVVREDGCDPSDIEPLKGAISGALKRAFSALCNRSLYDTDLGWHPIETYDGANGKKFKGWTDAALNAMEAKYNRQTGLSAPKVQPKPAPKALEAVAPAVPTTTASVVGTGESASKNAFGYVPPRWPPLEAYKEPRTVNQTGMGHGKAKERGVADDLYVSLRETVLDAFGFLYEDRKGHMMLWLDFLINATEESLAAATAATYERLGQGALL